MAKRVLSAAAKKAISEAAKRRWASYRADKAAGRATGYRKPGPKPKNGRRKPGRPANAVTVGAGLAQHSTAELITMRRQIDQVLAERFVRDFQG